MRQYSETDRSSAAASLARSNQRDGGTRSLSSSVFFSAMDHGVSRKALPAIVRSAGRGKRRAGDDALRGRKGGLAEGPGVHNQAANRPCTRAAGVAWGHHEAL